MTSDQEIINAALRAQAEAKAEAQGFDVNTDLIKKVKMVDNVPKVVAVKAKELTWVDQLKKYYKQAIAIIGAILVTINELTPITDMFGTETRHVISVVVVVLSALGVVLKENEHWIQSIPS